ncbi:C-terminal binding protein [Georgenia deserti]|uniref:C-terminal binding protein n=1 Tax=Georgenia deserti TaxID=2093781 RepID=A0ABW4LBA7_9MICO
MTSRVVVTDHTFPDLAAEERLAAEHGASFASHQCATVEETAEAMDGATVALVNFAPVPREALARLTPGATVIRYGIGYDNVDVEAARELGVQVANVPDYGVPTVADHAATSILTLARRLPQYDRRVRREGWLRPAELGPLPSFRSMVVGLVGLGRIAREVHARLAPFGFTVIAHDPFADPELFDQLGVESVDLLELARRAHAISLHAPSTPQTHHLVDDRFLAHVRPGTVLVNTARGPLIDTEALVAAVREGRVAAAALDVTDPEPPPADSPLWSTPDILLTPHAAFYDEDSVRALQRLAREEAGRALRGEPLRCRVA